MVGDYLAYLEYKCSQSEWLGDIPNHWEASPVKYLSDTVSTGGTPKNHSSFTDENQVSWFSPGDFDGAKVLLSSSKYVTYTSCDIGDARLYRGGSVVVIGIGATLGKVAYCPNSFSCNQQINVISPNKKALGMYLMYSLSIQLEQMKQASNASTIGIMNQEKTKTILVACPTMVEQRKIAQFLDHETAKIDTLIEKQQQLIKLLKEKRQAVISHAVTKGLNPNAPMRDSGVEWFDVMPDHWRIIELKFSAKSGRKSFTDGDWIESPYITGSGIRLLQTGNVGIGEFKEKGFRYVTEDTFNKLNCTEVKPRDVLICRLDGPVGRSCLAPDLGVKVITSVDNAILKLNDDFDPRYIVYLTNCTPWLEWIADLCRVGGGFRLRVSRTMLGDQRIPSPPIEEQTRIADELEALSDHYFECMDKSEKSIALLKERRTALISAAVTGKIDVRNWQAPKPSNTNNKEDAA